MAKLTKESSTLAPVVRMLPRADVKDFISLLRSARPVLEQVEPPQLRAYYLEELEDTARAVVRACRDHAEPRDLGKIEKEIFEARQARRKVEI
ncbi:MAG: hypothetical protein KGH94_04360 [Candidatus Micrarchaeota archaeon]|nr:hypothetical protein [Candidatus Micrarchaeota archaeon]